MFTIVAFVISAIIVAGLMGWIVKQLNKISEKTQDKIVFWTLATLGTVVVALWAAVGITALFRAVI